jgi:peptidyl-tRNA hydrolase, PTH1 family
LKSLISHLGTNEFTRLRIGVGPRPEGNELVDYVLGKFRPDEYEIFRNSLTEAADYVIDWMKQS